MFDLHNERLKYFFKENLPVDQRDNVDYVTSMSGIKDLLSKETLIDAWQFTPCGYSLNGVLNDRYWSIHVTPEPQASFISFETNLMLDSYESLVSKVINTFKPKRFSVSITTTGVPDNNNEISDWEFKGFVTRNYSSHRFSKRHHVVCGNWILECEKK